MEKEMQNLENQNQEQQKDNTPKWLRGVIWTLAIGTCSAAIAAFIGLFGDAPGQCIKNNNYTRNYRKRLDADFQDMVRRDQYNRKNNI